METKQCWLCLEYSGKECALEKRLCPLNKNKFPTIKINEIRKLESHISKCKSFFLEINKDEVHFVSSGLHIYKKGGIRNFLNSFGKIEEEVKKNRASMKDGVSVDFSKLSLSDNDEEEFPIKKKRGRPRKNPVQEILPELSEPQIKRKRGRPVKMN